MAFNGYPVFDSGLHVIEPADLWTRYIDPKYRDRAPIGVKDEPFSTGNLVKYDGGQYSPRREAVQYFEGAVDHWLEQAHLRGRYEQYLEFDKRDWGPDTQVEAMDTEGWTRPCCFPLEASPRRAVNTRKTGWPPPSPAPTTTGWRIFARTHPMELGLSDEQRRNILWDNCVRMYGFTPGG